MSPADPPQSPAGGGSENDPFSWLYQRGHLAPTEDVAPHVPPTVASSTPSAPPPFAPAAPVASPPTGSQPAPQQPPPPRQPAQDLPPGPQPSYLLQPYQPGQPQAYVPPPPPEQPKRRGLVVGIIVGVVLLAAIAGGVVVAVLVQRSRPVGAGSPATEAPAGPPSTPVSQPASASPAQPPATPVATGVSADCTAPPATDDAGAAVSYEAGNVLDGDRSTAWRCDGNGAGHTLDFTFPAGTTINQVGLVNGYTKTDPKSGAKRYGEYRRITQVTWTFDSGRTVVQPLSGNSQKIQSMTIEPTQAQTVSLTINTSTKPGWSVSSRNAVLISEVSFG